MRISFRVDASLQIGTGHVMRCLSLAEALRRGGAEVSFICRELSGNLIDRIKSRGIEVVDLPAPEEAGGPEGPPEHAAWAGVIWERDAKETASALRWLSPDWLIVDHYALDSRWELAVRKNGMRLMVIDDLADRPHDCDRLLDQNLGREHADYGGLVPEHCRLMIGPHYALLRPEFSKRRDSSLVRRRGGEIKRILISMGGIDSNNITARFIQAIQEVDLPAECGVKVVLGENTPWFNEISKLAASSKLSTTVLRGVDDMAELMSEADLAIGGAGSTSWERCCLGLPTLIVVLAKNQALAANALDHAGAAELLDVDESLGQKMKEVLAPGRIKHILPAMSAAASSLVDGSGVCRVIECLESKH